MIQNDTPSVSNSLWTAKAHQAVDWPVLSGDVRADVAIIGAGYTGLSAALHLAERGVSVAVLEAQTPGWGASGRNGGQVNPGLTVNPDQALRYYGTEIGERLITVSGAAPDLVFDLIRKHSIECDAIRPGWIRPAHNRATGAEVKSVIHQWQQRGVELRLLDPDETSAAIGSTVYTSAFCDPRGGSVHPLNYAQGLARAAQNAGAQIYAQSPVMHLLNDHVIQTPQGQVRAHKILVCTNAYTNELLPPSGKTMVPVRSVQVATEVLPDDLFKAILPDMNAIADMQRVLLYYRKHSSGRFIMGGRGTYAEASTFNQHKALRSVSKRLFPALRGVKWDYAWGGYLAVTPNHLPRLTQLSDQVIAGYAYNGRGVAMATLTGKVMADWAVGEANIDIPLQPAPRVKFHCFHRLGVGLAIAGNQMLDRLGV